MRAGRWSSAMIFAIVKVLPDPVTPSSVWKSLPERIDSTSFAIAAGWSPVGEYGEWSLKRLDIYFLYILIKLFTINKYLFYRKMHTKQPCIILPDFWEVEKSEVIRELSYRLRVMKSVQNAFDRMFWTQMPHIQIERIARQNSRAMQQSYNEQIFRVLWDTAPNDLYEDADYVKWHQLQYAWDWKDGSLSFRWEQSSSQQNPHHLVPKSRWWTNNPKNFWYIHRLPHNDFHTVFQNLTPIEQILLLTQVHEKLLSPDFIRKLQDMPISKSPDVLYKRGVLQKWWEAN
jgi:hypothetical protein